MNDVLTNPVPLGFGRHDLRVFDSETFLPWQLSQPAVPLYPSGKHHSGLPTRWNVSHAGHEFVVKQRRLASEQVVQGRQSRHSADAERVELLIHLMRDPMRKGNLLAIRKAASESGDTGPLGYFNAYSVFPNGDEEFIGYSKLVSYFNYADSAYLSGAGVVAHAFRKPATLSAELARRTAREDEAGARALRDSSEPFNSNAPEPGLSSVSYRGVHLGHLLIALSEEVAAKAGFRKIYTSAYKETAGFVARHGWTVLTEKEKSLWCVRHLRAPAGWRERLSAFFGRMIGAE